MLDTGAEPAFDDLTSLASEVLGAPITLVSLVDADRQWFKSRVGLDAEQTPRAHAVCGYAILDDEPLVIPDLTLDDRTSDNPLVTGEPWLRAYAGVPLVMPDGAALGTFCAIWERPRAVSADEVGRLRGFARQAVALLELRRAVHLLESSERRAQEVSLAKSRFLATMSHEIRTPLTAILGYSELLELSSTTEGAENDIGRLRSAINRNANHLLAILNDVLDLSKIEAGQFTVERIGVNPVRLVRDVVETYRAKIERKGLRFGVEWRGVIPGSITSDPTRLRQILMNLLNNAVKFTESGSIDLVCSCDTGRGLFEVSVRDTGIGMTPEQIDRISTFSPFMRVDESMTRMYGGSGLGLSIASHLACELGGGLRITSEYGKGSEFTFSVSTGSLEGRGDWLVPGSDSVTGCGCGESAWECEEAVASLSGEEALSTPLGGVHVLLAEDGPDNQRLLRSFLQRAGATVRCVGNGREAVSAFSGTPGFDLILMDIQMPVMDGYAATRVIRERGYTGPIIAVTAHAMSDDRERCEEAGCSGYLSKPISGRTLVEACVAALGREASREAA